MTMTRDLKVLLFFSIFFCATSVGQLYAQNNNGKAIASRQNAVQLAKEMEEERQEAYKIANKKGWKIYHKDKNGRIKSLSRIDEFGIPIYDGTENNTIAAATTKANSLYAGGSLGLSFNGSTIPIGKVAIWDGGSVRASHQEFTGGRVVIKDASTTTSDHATHVAGTMMASGVVANARGMAYGLPGLWSFDFGGDNSEMTSNAANLILSNHSYGTVAGWDYDSDRSRWEWMGAAGANEDYKFGYYDSKAQTWDQICFNNPYYLPLKSGGNYRSSNGPAVGANYYSSSGTLVGPRPAGMSSNDGYGIVATYATAKNIITVGAVNGLPYGALSSSDVIMSSFSAWGPTDDGRIKPDLVADGVSLYSTGHTSDTNYSTKSGTSMAAPNATGSLVLLQELYKQQTGNFMRSATLKGLVLGTTSEAGPAIGPDYKFGWGLLNVERAAKTILNNGSGSLISEYTLAQGATNTVNITAAKSGPLVATICWTDPAAIPVSTANALNNTSLRLINDLDMRGSDGITTYYPWVLNPANPALAATKGDNFRDNVEQVYIANAVEGQTYAFTISHKGSTLVNGSQSYSLIITEASTSASTPVVNGIRYVKPNGTGDGSSWDNAASDISIVLAEAQTDLSIKEIWVAAGTYKPTINPVSGSSDNRDKTFVFPYGRSDAANGLKMYGGFAGWETDLSERNWKINTTTLSGDFQGDDSIQGTGSSLTITNNSENAYHVVVGSAYSVIDGFTITGGKVSASSSSQNVNGMSVNRAYGGGLNTSGAMIIKNIMFVGNDGLGTDARGGAVYLAIASSVEINNSVFYQNVGRSGSGVYAFGSSGTTASLTNINNSLFLNNYGTADGSAINFNTGNANTIVNVTNCTFYGNAAAGNGTLYLSASVPAIIRNNLFWSNTSAAASGRKNIYSGGTGGSKIVTNSVIADYTGTMTSINTVTNVNANNPLFRNIGDLAGADGILGTRDDGLQVNSGSPAIGASAISTVVPNIDITGFDRPLETAFTIGAYEYDATLDLTLPVNIRSFTAELKNGKTRLSWNVGTEINVNRYEVERSSNGIDFVSVLNVAAKGAASYTASDDKPLLGINYYRLKGIDNDGVLSPFNELRTVKVLSLFTKEILIYPNPLRDNMLHFNVSNYSIGIYSYKILDIVGKVYQSGSFINDGSSNNNSITISSMMPKGSYVLLLTKGSEIIQSKFIKE